MILLALLLAALAVLWLYQFAWQAATATLARRSGIDVEEVSVGVGPSLWIWRRGEEVWRLKLLPLGGYTHLRNEEDFEQPQESNESPARTYYAASLPARVLMQLIGPGTSLLVGSLLLGLAVLLNSPQLVATAERPGQAPGLTHAQEPSSLWGQWCLAADTSGVFFTRLLTFQSLEDWGGLVAFLITAGRTGERSLVDWVTMLGLTGVTLGIWNLMPIPPMNGFHALHLMAAASVGRRRLPDWLYVPLTCAGLLLLLVLSVRACWLDACWLWEQFW
jgi:membrane-associated protease RseP (regulator of RpoE activity)